MVELVCPDCTTSFQATPGAVVDCPACGFRGGRVPGAAPWSTGYTVAEGEYTPDRAPGFTPPGTEEERKVETSRGAVTALVLGLCFFVPPAGLFALMFGVIALGQIRDAKARKDLPDLKGRGMAITGITLGAVFQLLWFVLIIALLAFGANNLDSILGR